MRTSFFVFGFLSVTLVLPAGQEIIRVDPQSLAGWSLVGAEAGTLAGQSELILPAGAQLVRSFPVTDVSIRLAVQPVIGETAENWPVLEIGSNALIFARTGTTGKLVLVIGEHAPQELPLTYALDVGGRSVESFALGFARVGSVVKVTTAGQEWSFPAGKSDNPSQVVLSAGAALPWAIQYLEVAAGAADPVAPLPVGVSKNDKANSADGGTVLNSEKAPVLPPITPAISQATAAKPGISTPTPTAAGPASVSTLEIFTAPAVRYGRADVVRAAVRSQTTN